MKKNASLAMLLLWMQNTVFYKTQNYTVPLLHNMSKRMKFNPNCKLCV
uniref:Uncharacterized protein n=1 Tax=Rhizophora mucronata TaxID=61149 RepID=A0A2P2PP27_RHIMU